MGINTKARNSIGVVPHYKPFRQQAGARKVTPLLLCQTSLHRRSDLIYRVHQFIEVLTLSTMRHIVQ